MVLSLVLIVNLICLGPMSAMITLAMGSGTVSDETTDEAIEAANQIAEEGAVLLENDGILPISPEQTDLQIMQRQRPHRRQM